MNKLNIGACAAALLLLGGCASMPSGPSVLVLPGSYRNLDDFRADEAECRQYAAQQLGGISDDPAVRNAAIATAVGAVAGAAIGGRQGAGVGAGAGLVVGSAMGAESSNRFTYDSQRQYDNAYIQCMYAKGHRVPVPASLAQRLRQADEPVSAANIPPPPPYAPPKSIPPDYVAPSR